MEGLKSFLDSNSIYIVMVIVLIVWIGIFIYLLGIDKRIKLIEKEVKAEKGAKDEK